MSTPCMNYFYVHNGACEQEYIMTKYIKFLQEASKRRELAGKLRAKGHTMQEIATKLGISRQRVSELLKDK